VSITLFRQNFAESRALLDRLSTDESFAQSCEVLACEVIELYRRGGNLFVCGNGGSHCDAMHFAEELTGRFRKNRRSLGALALGDPSHMTCVGNDFGFDHVFARQLEGLARKGDLLVGISTSGGSRNVILAVEKAKGLGLHTFGLLGRDGGRLRTLVDGAVIVPADMTDRIQEIHIQVIHSVIEACERALFPENYT